ncbi:MAG TPA: hypothetical protein VFT49_03410 [Candidatus Saccharimonadales bacterium]|nr:hypothetical protein [Candidatus Saccharimonadales bacterium]
MIKKLVSFFIIGILVVIFLIWLQGYLTNGNLTVTSTDSYGTITVTKSGGSTPIKQAKKSMSIKLRKGTYNVSITGNSVGASQSVAVKAHHNTSLQLNPPQPIGVEPVVGVGGADISANSQDLYFINGTSRGLNHLDSNNQMHTVGDVSTLISAQWAAPGRGVVQDDNGNLYSVSGDSLNRLSLPVSPANYLAVAPNGDTYYSSGTKVFKGTLSGSFKQVYTAKQSFTSLAAFNDGVAVIGSPAADNGKSDAGFAAIMFNTGKVVSKKISLYGSFAWSPNGKHLASVGNLTYEILDQNLNVVASIPNSSIANPMWVDSNTLLYTSKDTLWSYNMSSGKAGLIANMPLGDPILNGSVGQTGDYAYLNVSDQSRGQLIKRVALKGQQVSKEIYELQSIMPENIGECTADLVNFTGLTIRVRDLGEGPSNSSCQSVIQNDLSSRGIDLKTLNFTQD